MMLKHTNINALSEKSYECELKTGMRHIGFYLDGLSLMVDGKKDGMNYIPNQLLKLTLKNNGSLAIVENMETGFDLDRN